LIVCLFVKLPQARLISDTKNDAILMIITQQILERLYPLLMVCLNSLIVLHLIKKRGRIFASVFP